MLWRNIGLKLGLQDAVLNVIEHEHPNQLRKCFRITLQKWLNQDVSATWETLELVITNANRDDLNLDNLTKSTFKRVYNSHVLKLLHVSS